MNIRDIVIIAVLSIGASTSVLADDHKPANSQESYVPPLNLLMSPHSSVISSYGTRAPHKTGR
jgi:hypothetical protein